MPHCHCVRHSCCAVFKLQWEKTDGLGLGWWPRDTRSVVAPHKRLGTVGRVAYV